jgi:cell wall-associated NlpC family hydrolase
MRDWVKTATVVGLCGLTLCVARAQEGARSIDASASSGIAASTPAQSHSKTAPDAATRREREHKGARTLNSDDRLAVIASALDAKTPHYAERDCSHLVHAIYERAGFPYAYASSDDLYDGVEGFQRVSQPQTGDLVVWRGHAGIVIRPSRHVFFSFLHAGPGTDDYRSRYWVGRGEPRFYRYVKNVGCVGCTVARGRANP